MIACTSPGDDESIEGEDLRNNRVEMTVEMIEAHHDDKNYQAKEDASAPVGLYRDADVEEDLVGCNNKNKETEKVETNSN